MESGILEIIWNYSAFLNVVVVVGFVFFFARACVYVHSIRDAYIFPEYLSLSLSLLRSNFISDDILRIFLHFIEARESWFYV